MPTYNYQCKACMRVITIFQGINEEPLMKCDSCDGAINRVITGGAGIIFKGDGFYITDYNKRKNKSSLIEKVDKKEKSDKNIKTSEKIDE